MPIRLTVVFLVLALAAFGAACGDEGSGERASESIEKAGSESARVVGEEARGLADAAEQGGGPRAGEAVDRAARDAADTLDAPGGAEAVAEEMAEKVENSARVYGDSYEAARERGENALEAGGDAYNAVLDIPEEEAEEKRKEAP